MDNFEWLRNNLNSEEFSKFIAASYDCSHCFLYNQCDRNYKCEKNIEKWLNMDHNDKSKIKFNENEEKDKFPYTPSDEEVEEALNNYHEVIGPSEAVRRSSYTFPAILSIDDLDNRVIYVNFPDLEECFTDGENLKKAIENAKETLGNVLYWMEKDGDKIPNPTDIKDVKINENEIKTLITVDMVKVRDDWRKAEETKGMFRKIKEFCVDGYFPFHNLMLDTLVNTMLPCICDKNCPASKMDDGRDFTEECKKCRKLLKSFLKEESIE